MNRIRFSILIFSLLCFSCERKGDLLESALRYAGANRPELEKVLAFYKEEPLKYEAAVFLIENMPGHYSYRETDYQNAYYDEMDTLFAYTVAHHVDSILRDSLFREVKLRYSIRRLSTVSDIRIITADFLINNIDQAFSVWENSHWAKHLDFEMFCEYLLPYKVWETQIFEDWRTLFEDFATVSASEINVTS